MARVLSPEILAQIDKLTARYPTRLAALVPALHVAQKQVGYLPADVQMDVAEVLGVPPTLVREVVTFYTMFREAPGGRHMVRICRNLACRSRGAEQIMERAEQVLGIKVGQTTADGRVTLEHDECLAACGTGPALWCDDNLVENLTQEKLERFLAGLQ